MNTEQERAAFEAWCETLYRETSRDDEGDYIAIETDISWEAWQARAALSAQPAPATTEPSDENGRHRLMEPDHETALALADAPRSLQNYVAALRSAIDALLSRYDRHAGDAQPTEAFPCRIIEADFETGTVTLEMQGKYTVSAGQKYLCNAPLQSQDKENAKRYLFTECDPSMSLRD